MSSQQKPSLEQLREDYEQARVRSANFYDEAQKPLSELDKAKLQSLHEIAMDALANFYEAGGSLRTPYVPVTEAAGGEA